MVKSPPPGAKAPRRVLMLSYFYPPIGGIVSERSLLFSRILPEYGWLPVVVTPRAGTLRTIEAASGLEISPVTRVVRTGNPDIEFRLKRLLGFNVREPVENQLPGEARLGQRPESLRGKAVQALKNWLELPDRMIDWLPFAFHAARRAAIDNNVNAIYSQSPPYTTALVGAALSRATGIPWVADYPDAWTRDFTYFRTGSAVRIDRMLEGCAMRRCAALVTISDDYRDRFTSAYPFLDGRVTIIENAFDGERFDNAEAIGGEGFRVLYAGTLNHPFQDITPFLDAAAFLRREGDGDDIKLQYVGRDGALLDALARERALEGMVENLGQVSYGEALARQKGATALLYVQWEPGGGAAATGKLMQYVGARRPVLAIAPTGGEAHRILDLTGAGHTAADAGEAARVLGGWLREYRENGSLAWGGDESAVSSFDYHSAAGRIARVLDRIAGVPR